jgi:predicted ATPase with chaperone activity
MALAAIVAPNAVEEMRVGRKLLEELALKILYMSGERSLRDLAAEMRLSLAIVNELFQRLRKEQLCEVTGMEDGIHRIVVTSQGRARALELLSLCQYAGPAPVSLTDYVSRIGTQSVRDLDVHPADIQRAFRKLVLKERTLKEIGTAVVSGKTLLLYGPTGTGKTTIAETISELFANDQVWIPYAVEVDGQIITVYDPGVHESVEGEIPDHSDDRWVLCKRPRVLVGGELTIEMLDLQFNHVSKFYSGPVQMKANNGLLIIDDFGRQRMRPEELLNRWVVSLDRRIDFLTLAGGKKIEIPFDLFVVLATNLDPVTMVDEAFLRRLQTKIKVDHITREEFHGIARRVCSQFGLVYQPNIVDSLINVITRDLNQQLRACYPRDILQQICWAARYEKREPQLNWDSVAQACGSYFLPPQS